MHKIKLDIIKDDFIEFLNKLEDLTKIAKIIKMKIDNEHIMVYSILGKTTMLAFKNYLINTNDLFKLKNELEHTINLVILDADKFVKNLKFLLSNEKLSILINAKESSDDENILNARNITLTGDKLKINWVMGEEGEIKDIEKSIINRLQPEYANWEFTIDKKDFDDIKKLSKINGERILNISTDGGDVIFSESKSWELNVDKIESKNTSNLILNKMFLSTIKEDNDITFYIFDNFMLLKHEDSNLMLSMEQDFVTEDEV